MTDTKQGNRKIMLIFIRGYLKKHDWINYTQIDPFTFEVSYEINSVSTIYRGKWHGNNRWVIYPDNKHATNTLWNVKECITWAKAILGLVNTRSRRPNPKLLASSS